MNQATQNTQSGINWWKVFVRVQNPMMKWLLKSPLHFFVSKQYMLITVIGRKTGNPYLIPVQYAQQDHTLRIITSRDYTWWKNLEGGTQVDLRLCGQSLTGEAEISFDHDDIRDSLTQLYPSIRADRVAKFLNETLVVKITLPI